MEKRKEVNFPLPQLGIANGKNLILEVTLQTL